MANDPLASQDAALLCGCCEGTEQLTPAIVANRPGLPALAYRVGTHARFFETMKARLAGVSVDVPFAEVDEHGIPFRGIDRLYPIAGLRKRRIDKDDGSSVELPIEQVRHGLTTRSVDDPAIALLDGWATVADVLTFYQERIANEGYLRTATERRSILELARLVGYALRPGVAATVYLAYTIDETFKDTAVIDVGARAQSVPGPGELPQSFETVEKLKARAAWNALKPLMGRPQVLPAMIANRVIYLKGITANLKSNDALLVGQAGSTDRTLMRVTSVTIEPEADRTIVKVMPWEETFSVPVSQTDRELAAAITAVAREYGAEETLSKHNVDSRSKMALRVFTLLQQLDRDQEGDVGSAKRQAAVDRALHALRDEHRVATDGNFVNLKAWLSDMVADIERVVAARGRAALTPGTPAKGGPDPLLDVMAGLSVPASVPPANAFRLGRDLGTAFAERADAGLQVVSALHPELGSALPAALGNVQAIAPSELEVHALRLKTGVYGNTASPRTVLDQQGRVVGTEDWPLNPYTFAVHVTISEVSVGGDSSVVYNALIQVKAGGQTFSRQVPLSEPTAAKVQLGPNIHAEVSHTEERSTFTILETDQKIEILGTQEGARFISATRDSEKLETQLSIGQSASQFTGRRKLAAAYELSQSALVRTLSATLTVEDEVALPVVPRDVVALDGVYEQITPGSWVAIPTRPNKPLVVTQVARAQAVGRTSFSFPAKVTELKLGEDWLTDNDLWLADIRDSSVLAQSEQLELAEEPIAEPICGGDQWVELDGIYSDLQAGRWVIVAGEREDIRDAIGTLVPGLMSAERVILAEIQHDIYRGQTELPAADQGNAPVERPGDRNHTFVKFARPLAYCYKRSKVTIYGNVVKATHGETRPEVMGSGDGSKAFQAFTLRQPPLTFVSAPNAAGAASTLEVYVNNVRWDEADTLSGLQSTDRRFITRTDDDGKTTVVFGDGRQGARLPTGIENVRAQYRMGIGKPGNAQAEQISLLQTRPLGVRGVINPLRASGGADKESRDQARKNAPLAVMALDRLVSLQDYADFARTLAGVGKAVATRTTDGRRELVHVTIAGADDIPIDRTSDLYRNLLQALHDLGDPALPVRLDTRELLLLALQAKVHVSPQYLWESVVSAVRSKLYDIFSFERRELGQPVLLSEVISVMQRVPGVAYVDVDTLGGIPEKKADTNGTRRLLTPAEITAAVQALLDDPQQPAPRADVNLAALDNGAIRPAQLAFLSPAVPDTLVLNQI